MKLIHMSLIMFSIFFTTFTSIAQEDVIKPFVATKSGDTIYVQGIKDHQHFWQKERRYILKLENGRKQKLLASEISTFSRLKDKKLILYKIVEVQQSSGSSYLREMEILHLGLLNLYREWHERNAWFYVESSFYTGFLEDEKVIENMMIYLASCNSFKQNYSKRSSSTYENLPDIVEYYNTNCKK